jgi:hypothetical protein
MSQKAQAPIAPTTVTSTTSTSTAPTPSTVKAKRSININSNYLKSAPGIFRILLIVNYIFPKSYITNCIKFEFITNL